MANNKEELSTEEPHNNDVLCGRGGTINAHPGNEQYRKFVDRKKRVYLTARFKREKRLIAQSIVDEVRSLKPPGRFLLKDSKTNIWSDVGDEKARDKTSQALRENALTVRKQMEKEYQESYKKQIREDAIAKGLDPDVAVEKITSSVMGDINEYDGKANSVKPSQMVENEKKKKQQQQQQAVAAKSKKATAKQQQTTTTAATTAAAQQQVQQQLQAQQQMQLSQSPMAQADNQWLIQQQQQVQAAAAAQAQQNQAVGYTYLPQQAGIVDQQQQMNTLQSIQQQQQQAAQFQQQFLSAPQGVTQQPQLSQSAPQSMQPTNEEYQQFLKWKESQQQQQTELQKQALQAAQQAAQLQAAQAQSQQPQHTISHQSTMSAAHAQWTANNQPVHIAAPPPTHTTIATTTNNSNNNPPVTAINLRPSRNMPSSLNSSRDSSPSTTDRHVQFSQSNMTDYTPPDNHDQSISSPRSEHHSTTNMSQAMSQHTPLTFLSTDMSVKTSDSLNYYLQGLEDEISGDVGQEVELIAHAPMLDGSLSDTIGPPQPRNVAANQQQQHHGGIPSYTRSTPPRHGSSSHSHKSGNSKSSRSRRSRKRRSGNHIPSNSGKVQLDLSNLGGPSSSGAPTYQPVAAAGGMGYQQSGGVILPTPIRNTSGGSAKRSPPSSAMAPPPALVPLLSPGGNHLYQQAQSNMSVPMSPGSMVNSLDLDKMSLCETENVSTHGGSIGGASLCNVFDDQDGNSIIGSIGSSGGRAAMMDMTMSLGSHPSSGGNSGGSTTQPQQQSGDNDINSLQNMQPLGYQYSGENESLIGASSALMDMSVGSHSKHSGSGSGSNSKNSGGSSTSRASRRSGSPASRDKADVKIIHQQFVNEGREQPPGGQQETPTPMPGQDYNFWDGKRAE